MAGFFPGLEKEMFAFLPKEDVWGMFFFSFGCFFFGLLFNEFQHLDKRHQQNFSVWSDSGF